MSYVLIPSYYEIIGTAYSGDKNVYDIREGEHKEGSNCLHYFP
jgi:hypothetical protein